jgi:ribosome biogenesis protein Nip4
VKRINDFISLFQTSLSLEENFLVEKKNRYFLLNQKLKELIYNDFFHAGAYLGKARDKVFFPSFILLDMIAESKKANKIMVDEKTAWLFICGRDIFKRGITNISGSKRKGDYTLILNQHEECLGFGKILHNIGDDRNSKVVVKNISDIGDFLRREKHFPSE